MRKLSLFFLFLFVQIQFVNAQGISPKEDDIVKVLAIGNSFSQDAIENYLFDISQSAGKKVMIGNLYIGGAPLELHLKNAHNNVKAYSFRTIALDGTKKTVEEVSIQQAIESDNWDYISLQQASSFSGKYNIVMESLTDLWTYVYAHMNPDTKLVYHQTWAYQQDSKHKGFDAYGNDQQVMYDSIMNVTSKIDKSKDFAFIIPSGTAIQNGRSSSIGDHYTRDGYHLNLDYGRFTAALTWYAKLFGLDPRKNNYKPEKVTEVQAKIAREAAYKAVKKPFKSSKIKH